MLGPQAPATEPAPIADLTKQVTTAWRLRQRANCDALGQLLPPLLSQAESRAAAGSDEAEQAGRVVVHAYNASSSLLRKLGDGPLARQVVEEIERRPHLGYAVVAVVDEIRSAGVDQLGLLTEKNQKEKSTPPPPSAD